MSLTAARNVARRPLPSAAVLRSFAPSGIRHAGSKALSDPASEQNQDARLSNQEPGPMAVPEHTFDPEQHVDHATSYVHSPSRASE